MRAVHLRRCLENPEVRPLRMMKIPHGLRFLPGGEWVIVTRETNLWILRVADADASADLLAAWQPLFSTGHSERTIKSCHFDSMGNQQIGLVLSLKNGTDTCVSAFVPANDRSMIQFERQTGGNLRHSHTVSRLGITGKPFSAADETLFDSRPFLSNRYHWFLGHDFLQTEYPLPISND